MVGRRFVGLDGLKGIALIAIVLYHCDQGVLPGGFLGVDVFFTISGFLIVSSLLRRIDAGRGIGWGEYYLKRFRRIYPALLALIPITVAMAWFINRDMLVGIRNQILTVLLGCYNWYAISSGSSYFAQMNPDMFRHMWFMSVLMQFYLLVPIAVYVLLKSLHRWIPVFVLTGLAICSALSMGLRYHIDDDPTRVYFGSDTHAMGLWLGAAFAWALMLLRHGNGRVSETQLMDRIHARWGRIGPIAAFVALLALLWMMRHIGQGAMSFRFAIASASTLSVVLIAGSIPFGSWMQDLLVFRPLAMIGRYSYGIYLWHWPLWLLVRAVFPQWGARYADRTLAVTVMLTAVFAVLSWMLFERPVARAGFIALIRPTDTFDSDNGLRLWATVLVLTCTWSFAGYAVANAPAQTGVQTSLEANARMLQRQRRHDVLDRRKVPRPKRPVHTMPSGHQMTAIGDSVMLASSKGLQSVFPGITVDAETSRSMLKAQGLIDQAKGQSDGLRQWVLIGLATNSVVTDDQLNDILDDIGPEHVLVLINAHAPVSWVPDTNDTLRRFAEAHSDDVVLVDWDAAISAHADELAGDGIHPGVTNTIYAQTVKDAIQRWIKQGH